MDVRSGQTCSRLGLLMGAILGAGLILFFALVNAFLWGDGGYDVHLIGTPVNAYSLVWAWIGMIAIICGTNYAIHGGQKHPISHVIGIWWVANIGMTTALNSISYRGIEEQGDTIMGMPSLIIDFLPQASVDILALAVIWVLVARQILKASFWLVVFCGYLVFNLFGHAMGAYNLMAGVDADVAAQAYDSFMYLTFTVMLVLQTIGAGGDAILRWSGANVDLYRDIRPYFHSFASRHIHLS